MTDRDMTDLIRKLADRLAYDRIDQLEQLDTRTIPVITVTATPTAPAAAPEAGA